jgi:pimeloyl-ACP methyl ester carboxylesterase
MSEWNELQMRIHGEADRPTVIYLPGIHGDWTLVSSFRVALGNRVRFIEFTYPRTRTWSLDDHARAVLDKLAAHGVQDGWIVAESFSSVVAWAVLERAAASGFGVKGVILSGGFVRYPYPLLVHLARALNRAIPFWMVKMLCWIYGRYATVRHRQAPETLEGVAEFARRRCEEADRQAMLHRYNLILESDARRLVQNADIPIYQLCGSLEPVVPWWPVRRWLRRHCPTYKGSRLIWRADHNVLGTAPRTAAEQVISWIDSSLTAAV